MARLAPKLTPFWYEPEFQDIPDPVSVRLRPLTQADMIEIEELYEDGIYPTRRAYYRAGRLAITEVRGLFDDDGAPAKWPACADRVERHLVVMAGFRAITEQSGGDWAVIVREMRARMEGEPVDEKAAEPHEDPEKN